MNATHFINRPLCVVWSKYCLLFQPPPVASPLNAARNISTHDIYQHPITTRPRGTLSNQNSNKRRPFVSGFALTLVCRFRFSRGDELNNTSICCIEMIKEWVWGVCKSVARLCFHLWPNAGTVVARWPQPTCPRKESTFAEEECGRRGREPCVKLWQWQHECRRIREEGKVSPLLQLFGLPGTCLIFFHPQTFCLRHSHFFFDGLKLHIRPQPCRRTWAPNRGPSTKMTTSYTRWLVCDVTAL